MNLNNSTPQIKQFRAANNRAYYSIFHSICAVLAKEGLSFKRHKDIICYFNKNYIYTEIFPKELGRKIITAEQLLTLATKYLEKATQDKR